MSIAALTRTATRGHRSRSAGLLLIGAAAMLLAACGPNSDALTERRMLAMGTWVDVSFEMEDRARAERILDEIEALLRDFERDYYAWGDGELAELNARLARGEPMTVSPGLAGLLREAERLSAASERLFEPAIGALVELWGFHSEEAFASEPPAAEEIRDLLRSGPTIAALSIDDARVSSASRALKIDLGGIAKGEAVDRIIALLENRGVVNALVNAGGDLRAIGQRGQRPWRIGIKAPRDSGLVGVIELAPGEAAFTSGDYERFYDYDGRRLHHILDPTTGYPAEHTRAVTVVAADGVTADAAATALFVAGPERWRGVARSIGVDLVLRIDAAGQTEATDEMLERVHPAAGQAPL